MAQEILLTAEGYEELKNELQQLKTVKRTELAEKIKTAHRADPPPPAAPPTKRCVRAVVLFI